MKKNSKIQNGSQKLVIDYGSDDAISVKNMSSTKCIEVGCKNGVSKFVIKTTGGYCMTCYMDTAIDFGFGG